MIKPTPLSRAATQVVAVLGVCLLAFACPAAAFTPSTKTPGGENTALNLSSSTAAAPHASSGGPSIVRTIVGLAIVIAVIWGVGWIVRQAKTGRDPQTPSAGLASVAALTLSNGRSVHLVRVGNDYVLLGSAEHGVVPIHRYSPEQAQEAGLLLADPPRERSRLAAAGQIIVGAGRVVARGGVSYEEEGIPGGSGLSNREDGRVHSPVVGPRGNPMGTSTPSSGVVERLREWTVRH